MYRAFTSEIRRVVIGAILCIFAGLLIGKLAWTLVVGGAFYMGWMLWQIRQFEQWTQSRKLGLPPEASGIWGEIFDRIYHLQKRQEREKQRLQAVLNRVRETTSALPDAVIILDDKGNLNWWNQTASDLLGFRPTDATNPLINFIRDPQFIRYFDTEKYNEPITLTSPRDDNKYLQFQITWYGQGERLVTVQDITRIQRLEQMRKDFVANVSHELRTPLTVIKGYLETLDDMSVEIAPIWQKPISQMQKQCDRMNLLINDLIVLSKLETDEREMSNQLVPMKQLLEQVRSEAMVMVDGKYTIEVECPQNKFIRGSQKELHSALSNLVVNAIKYSPENTTIKMVGYVNNSGCYLSVIDQGIGIEAQHIPRLTERFYRVESSRSTETGGTGLGLAIVKHVLLRHDARLLIESRPMKGSTFSCVFPLSRVQENAA